MYADTRDVDYECVDDSADIAVQARRGKIRGDSVSYPSCSLAYTVGVCQPACMLLPRIYSGCLSGCLYVCLLYGIVAASRIYEQDSLFFSYFLPLSGVYIR